jgi:hypothetical protein
MVICTLDKALSGGSTTETPMAKKRKLGYQVSYVISARNRRYSSRCKDTVKVYLKEVVCK